MDNARAFAAASLFRSLVIGLTAFLTVVDLFATQAILPSLTRALWRHAGGDGLCGQRQHLRHGGRRPRRRLLQPAHRPAARHPGQPDAAGDPDERCSRSRPTSPSSPLLRVVQGLCMASAFTLTLAYLGEQCSAMDAGGAFAAYITGNVASNLVGRLISAAVADHFGLASNFYFFAALNLAGAVLVYFTVAQRQPMRSDEPAARSPLAALGRASGATRRCAPPSASASASCSPSSAPSPSSISCWCGRRCRSA